MTLSIPVLAGDDLGPGSPNQQRVAEVRALAAACSDAVPFLLVPVRLQTRFVQAELPADGQISVTAQVTGLLNAALTAATALAGRNYTTVLPAASARDRRAFKTTVEQPLVDAAAADLAAISSAVSAAQLLMRDVGEAPPADAVAAQQAASRLDSALAASGSALGTVRSPYHRAALTAAFGPVQAAAGALLAQVSATVQPAADIFAALRASATAAARPAARPAAAVPDGAAAASRLSFLPPPGPAGPGAAAVTMPRARIAASGRAYAQLGSMLDTIASITASMSAVSAPVNPVQRAAEASRLAATLADASAQAAAIAILPDAWQQQLAQRVAQRVAGLATARGTQVTPAVADQLGILQRTISSIAVAGSFPVTVSAEPTRIVDQLRIRIFPDDFSVVTHEPQLTAGERDAGAAFWSQAVDGGADDTATLAAWRTLAAGHGPNRAAWIAKATRPGPVPQPPPGVAVALAALATVHKRISDLTASMGTRLDSLAQALRNAAVAVAGASPLAPGVAARIAAQAAGIDAELDALRAAMPGQPFGTVAGAYASLVFALEGIRTDASLGAAAVTHIPDGDLKSAPWTMPPQAGLLPHRFVAIAVSGDQVSHAVAGGDVRPGLALGLDPREENAATETPHVAADGSLVMGASLAWLTDFDEASAAGMAITIPITAQEAAVGFDRVYVLGLDDGVDPAAAAQQLAAQLDNHHYTARGLALVSVGTPTNNTDAGFAGYRGAEDADAAYAIEMGSPLVTGTAGTPDGRRLAASLGLDPSVFDHVAGAGGHDVDSALTANAALWPATAGYALEELLGEIIPVAGRDKIAAFATSSVIGRGALPALRVGPQPYGVLPAIAFSRYQPSADVPFQSVLRDVLLVMFQDWADAAAASPRAYGPGAGGGQDQVLSVLGLDAVAAGYAQRFAVNAGRSGIGFGWGAQAIPPNVISTRIRTGPTALLQRFQAIFDATGPITPGPLVAGGTIAGPYAGVYGRITGSRGYEVNYIDPPATLADGVIVPATAAQLAGDVTAILAEDLGTLAADLGTPSAGRPLAHLLLCQALLVQARDVALRILVDQRIIDESLRARVGSSDLFTIPELGGSINVTRWSFLLDLLSRFDGKLGPPFPAGTIYDYLRGYSGGEQRMDNYLTAAGDNALARGYPVPLTAAYSALLTGHRAAVQQFGALDPEVAERVTIEHLDTCSHRLDAWLLGFANGRLSALRAATPTGVHVGAFGWIDGLQPAAAFPAAVDLPAVLNTDPGTPVFEDAANEGFIHAPSLNHAATAAIMRAGYVAHAGGTGAGTQMSVNISSRRVRAAFALLDGVSAGNELGALLGYQFERDLHDAADGQGPVLDPLIAPLRMRFPSAASVDAAADIAAPDARFVVDGLQLLSTVQADLASRNVTQEGTLLAALTPGTGSYPGYPYGLLDAQRRNSLLPPVTDPRSLDAVLRAIDRLADAVDAVADLALAEGTHQLVQGNHPRAAAALSALGAGKMPARPQIADTPVAGPLISHRVLLHLDPAAGPPAGWTAASARAAAEPALNAWLGALIGPPGMTRAQVVGDDGGHAADVSLTDLDIQPIDLLAMLHNGLDAAMTELSVRILDTLRPVDVRDGAPAPVLRVSPDRGPDWPAEVRSLAETSALVESVAMMMRGARPATSADYVLTDTVTAAGAGADTAELAGRVTATAAALTSLGGRLVTLVSDGADSDLSVIGSDAAGYAAARADTYRAGARPGEHLPGLDRLWARRQDFRAALLDAMGFGITGIVLPSRWDSRDQIGAAWLGAAESALVEVARRLSAAAAAATAASRAPSGTAAGGSTPGGAGAGVTAGTDVRSQLAQLTALFTDTLPVIPQFRLSNAADVMAAMAAPPTAEPALAAGRWLAGTAAVRENIGAYTTASALAVAFGSAAPDVVPVQFPVVSGEPWVGEAAPAAPGSRVSLLLLAPERLGTGTGPNAALCIDSWDEIMPASARTTGVAFHYDQPDAEPPQALLLAVPPAIRGAWQWEDLLQTLHDTLELARIRVVEPEQLQDDLYGQLLPLLLGEQQPWGDSGTTVAVSDHRVFLDFGEIVPASAGGTS